MVNQYGSPVGSEADGAQGGVTSFTINLSGTTSQTISSKLRGSIGIGIESVSTIGPTYYAQLAKQTSISTPVLTNVAATPADDSTALGVSWNANEGIKLSKNTTNHDGQYTVTLYN